MKGLSTALVVVITIVVLLVIALVVLSIFSGTAGKIGTLTAFRNQCTIEASTVCLSTGSLPTTWNLPQTVREGNQNIQRTCSQEFPNAECVDHNLQGI